MSFTTAVAPRAQWTKDLYSKVVLAIQDGSVKDTIREDATVYTVEQKLTLVGPKALELGTKGRSAINGVSVQAMTLELVNMILFARSVANYGPLFEVLTFAVAVGFTTAEQWVEDYVNLTKPNCLSAFEVEKRATIAATSTHSQVSWVASSNMNAHAVRILGHIIVEAGSGSGFFKDLKESAGTIFNPSSAQPDKERTKLTLEESKTLTESDKQAFALFKQHFKSVAEFVGELYGAGPANLEHLKEILEDLPKTAF